MKTKYFVLFVLVTILATLFAMLVAEKVGAKTESESLYSFPQGVGDCFADKASGDFYPRNSCILVELRDGSSAQRIPAIAGEFLVVETDKDGNPTVIVEYPPFSTPDDEENPSQEVPEEPVCKNKNQFKEGTSDCNAGKGND